MEAGFFFRLRHRKHSPTSYDESDETIMKWRLSPRFAVGSPEVAGNFGAAHQHPNMCPISAHRKGGAEDLKMGHCGCLHCCDNLRLDTIGIAPTMEECMQT